MKHIFLLAVSAVLLLLASCSETKDESASFGEYLAVKVVGEENWSIIDVNTGSFVCRNEFINRPKQISEDFFFVEKDKGKGYECYDVHNLSSAVNTEPYFSATYYEGGFSPVVYMDTTIIIVNKACKEVGSLAHNIVSAQPFRNGFSVIYTNEREAGLIDTLGNVVIRPQFDVILPMSSDGYAVTCKKMNDTIFNYAIIDSTCAKYYTFTSEKYDPVTGLENGSMAVKKNHKVVYIDRDGNRLFDAGEYVKGTSASYGVFDHMTVYASETGKMGVMTDKGEKLIRDKYDLLVPLRDGNFIAYQNGKCGVIDRNDGRILPFEYESIVKVAADRLVVKEGENRYYIIDMKGNEISKETFTAVALKENSLKSYLESLILIKSSASEQQMMEELRKYAATYSTSQEDIDEQMKDWEKEYMGLSESTSQPMSSFNMQSSNSSIEGTHHLTGSISKYAITMDIYIDDELVEGSYYYHSQGSGNRMELSGSITGSELYLDEYAPDGNNTGYFSGRFNGSTYSGTFTNNLNGKTMSFSISQN